MPTENSYTVYGAVLTAKGEPVSSQNLYVVDIDLKGAALYHSAKTKTDLTVDGFQHLGVITSDADGLYSIKFDITLYSNAERGKADVVVFALDGSDNIVGRSHMVNAREYNDRNEVRNVHVVLSEPDNRTEYELLMSKLTPFLIDSGGVQLLDLSKSDEQVSFTANELDEHISKIRIAVDAEVINAEIADPDFYERYHEILYGIGRQQVTLTWLSLYRRKEDELKTTISDAVRQNIIQKFPDAIIDIFLGKLHDAIIKHVINYAGSAGSATLDELLANALIDPKMRKAFIDALRRYKGDYRDFWSKYLLSVPGFTQVHIDALLLTQQLTLLSGNYNPLIKELQVARKITSVARLLELDKKTWDDILKITGTPSFIEGKDPAEKAETYRKQILEALNTAYPTKKVSLMVANDELTIPGDKDDKIKTAILGFIKSTPEFDLSSSRISDFDSKIKDEKVAAELKSMQRILQVSTSPSVMNVLKTNGLDSAYAITAIPKNIFISNYSAQLPGGEEGAAAVYERASFISNRSSGFVMKMMEASHAATPALVTSDADREEAMKILQANVPNYSELFGSPDMCECSECRSVFSASAYFVELLRFLEKGTKNGDGKTPLDIFAARRPDLLFLPLTCENTNTVIPYIDLVNEIMEYYTSHGKLDSAAAHDTGDTTAAELRANPQYVEAKAYGILKDAVYPFSLPYHQPLDVIRTYGAYLQTSRYEVMKAMRKTNATQTDIIATDAESLNISEEEFIALTEQKFDGTKVTRSLHEYYGYTSATDLENMAGTNVADGIHEFLRRSGIQYIDLVELLKTRFINPYQDAVDYLEKLFANSKLSSSQIYDKLKKINDGASPSTDKELMDVLTGANISSSEFATWVEKNFDGFAAVITLFQPESLCDLGTTCLRTIANIYEKITQSGINTTTWSKIHRFIRLWRKLGWTIHELDLVLAALGQNDITASTIAMISSIAALKEQLRIPLDQLATFWGNIDTYGRNSLYAKLFLTKTIQRIDGIFVADKFGNYLPDSSQKLKDHLPAIMAAFRLSQDELQVILDTAKVIDKGTSRTLDPATDSLSIVNLSTIYRYAVLGKALSMKISDCCTLIDLFEINPFNTWDITNNVYESIAPATSLEYCNIVAAVSSSGFKPAVLQYICKGTVAAGTTGIDRAKIAQTFSDIQNALTLIDQDYPDTPSAQLDADMLRSALLASYDQELVQQLISIIQSKQTFKINTGASGIIIPADLSSKYSFDKSDIICKGIVTGAERVRLKALSGDSNFKAAIDNLYQVTNEYIKSCEPVSILVNTKPDIKIPDALSPKYTYLQGSGRLLCKGVVSDDEKDVLGKLDTLPGTPFANAVNALYAAPHQFLKDNFGISTPADIAVLLNHPTQTEEADINTKLTLVYKKFIPVLKQKMRKGSITQHIALLLGANEKMVSVLMQNDLPVIEINKFADTIGLYDRAMKFITGFNLDEKELAHFIAFKAVFAAIDFKALTAAHWKRIDNYVRLRKILPQTSATLIDVFAAAEKIPATDVNTLISFLSAATSWDKTILNYLVNTHFVFTASDFKNEIAFVRIYNVIKLISATGATPAMLSVWANASAVFDDLNAAAKLVKGIAKAKYEEEDWLSISGRLNDKIRENQKQALISHLLTKKELQGRGIKDAGGLFEYFLIDVQMGACMDTSRIVQANASIQQFVSRCLLNLEKGVAPDAVNTNRWQWMKQYRVWEANRKVFLYPENWLEPEWRDNRSPFFKDLESELIQNDITPDSVDAAFRSYLTKLNEVANVDVCGVYKETGPDDTLKLMHVVARTHTVPYQFYYRTWDKLMNWSAWEKIPVDIRSIEAGEDSGAHVIPVVWKGRLFIFWPEFTDKQRDASLRNDNNQVGTTEELSQKPVSELKPDKYMEVRLAWTEYANKIWKPKQLTKEFIEIDSRGVGDTKTVTTYPLTITNPVSRIFFKTEIQADGLVVKAYTNDAYWLTNKHDIFEWGYFRFADIQAKPHAVSGLVKTPVSYESGNKYSKKFEKREAWRALAYSGNTYLSNAVSHQVVFSNDTMEREANPKDPFFYQDALRTYFAYPYDAAVVDQLRNPAHYEPPVMRIPDDSHYIQQPQLNGFIHHIAMSHFPKPLTDARHLPAYIASGCVGDEAEDTDVVELETPMTLTKGVNGNGITNLQTLSVNSAFAGSGNSGWFYNNKAATTGFVFQVFYHPFSSRFVTNLNTDGIKGLLESNLTIQSDKGSVFEKNYKPNFTGGIVKKAPGDENYTPSAPYTFYKENVCFDLYGANSIYNWELFFHAPLYIATRLSKNGKYEEAMHWFHYIFDPTSDEMPLAGQSETSRYWKVLPFKYTPAENLEKWFRGLSGQPENSSDNTAIAAWRDNPFKPHLIARGRPVAYMKNVVLKYVENLLAWGDSLFRMDTMESVNEALQIYVIANHILGPRPQYVPKRGTVKPQTYDSLKGKWDGFSNALVEMENIFPYTSAVPVGDKDNGVNMLGVGQALYFGIPGNGQLLKYWDTVADRLFKIRHCMNIDGVERKLALFAPPIDPGMLINAAAQGLSLGSILTDIGSQPPLYRFSYMLQRANDFCAEVKALGSTLLSILEKKDGEELGRLRATHETQMMLLMTAIKERQVLEAKSNQEGLVKSRETAKFRLAHYVALLDNSGVVVPDAPSLDANLTSNSSLPADTSIAEIKVDVDDAIVQSDERGVKLIPREKEDIVKGATAMVFQNYASLQESIASVAHFFPNFSVDGKLFGIGPGASFGGSNIGAAISAAAKIPQIISSSLSFQASQAAKMASFIRREQEWTLQANLAIKEIIQLDKQITSAGIRVQVTEKELANHLAQVRNTQQAEQFLKDKFTGKELYQWMKEQLFTVYKQSYNMAYELAKKAESCFRRETGNELSSFIQYSYWDSTQQGLCAGEKLHLALRQMEKTYLEENRREFELTKNISLANVNPLALQELRATGKCNLVIPEELFDLDYQGHYFRRIKSVSVSIPCIVGPYTSVGCTLRLLKNNIRINTSMNSAGKYEHENDEGLWIDDVRFRSSNISVKAISTSSAQRDTGMFEMNFHDERYLPFEGAGVISEWKIELVADRSLRQFDYNTLSDIIIHINYTAREDAGLFKEKATQHIREFLVNAASLDNQPMMRMFSLKHDFPTEWHKFLHPAIAGSEQKFALNLKQDHFPYLANGRSIAVKRIDFLVQSVKKGDYRLVLTWSDTKDKTDKASDELQVSENIGFGNMQMVTMTGKSKDLEVEKLRIYDPLSLKLKHTTAVDYSSLETNPDELGDVFMVVHYALGG